MHELCKQFNTLRLALPFSASACVRYIGTIVSPFPSEGQRLWRCGEGVGEGGWVERGLGGGGGVGEGVGEGVGVFGSLKLPGALQRLACSKLWMNKVGRLRRVGIRPFFLSPAAI